MSRCEFSGLSPIVKNLVSHSNIKTKSRAFPNVQKRNFYSLALKRSFRAFVSVKALKDIDKFGGVDFYLIKQKDDKLSPRVLKIKKSLSKKVNKKIKSVKS